MPWKSASDRADSSPSVEAFGPVVSRLGPPHLPPLQPFEQAYGETGVRESLVVSLRALRGVRLLGRCSVLARSTVSGVLS